MSVLLDHLTAILVGVTLLVAGVYVQHRGSQGAVEAAVHGNVQAQVLQFISVVERDLENVRMDEEAAHRLGFPAAGLTQISRDAQGTTLLRFPTLLDPGAADAAAASALGLVTYRREWTGRTVRVGVDADGQPILRESFRVVRWVHDGTAWRETGGSPPFVTRFDVAFLDVRGARVENGAAPADLDRVEVAVLAAGDGPGARAGDQAATTRMNGSRYAVTPRTYHRATQQLRLDGPPAPPPPNADLPPAPAPPSGPGR